MKTGWIATSGDGSKCGHVHRTYNGAAKCIRSQIYSSRRDVAVEAREHGIPYRDYVAKWIDDFVYWQDENGCLHKNSEIK